MPLKRFDLILNTKISSFKKIISVDSDKSISIRSFLIGAISQNISTARNVLESEDVFSTINSLKKIGVKIIKQKKKNYIINGQGLGSKAIKKNSFLNFGNSGTLARLLIGILSTTPNVEVKISGDKSLNKRSMKKLINLMSQFGALFFPKDKYNFPLRMVSTEMPIGINYKSGVSAQLKSAVILAALNSYVTTKIIELDKSRNHTENMLLKNKQVIKIKNNSNKCIEVMGKKYLNPINVTVPGDPSSAAFFTALTILNKNYYLIIKNVGLNKTRTGFYELLKKQGAKIKFSNLIKNNELRGDILVRSSNIKPIKASKIYYVNSTDEYPILFVIAALSNGVSVFKGISDLANKESNRILEMQKVLKQIGIKSNSTKNELKIFGNSEINVK